MSQNIFTQNYYELFNVSEDASQMEIKHAYARLIRQYSNETHPEEFMHIRQAYQVLSNPASRADYDNQLNGHANESYNNSGSYNTNQSYQDSYNDQTYQDTTYYDQSYNDQTYQDNTYNDQSYNDEQVYEDYYQNDNQYQNTYEQTNTSYQNDQTYQNYQSYDGQYSSTTQAPAQPNRSFKEYSLLGNIIISVIIMLMFQSPVAGIIAGIVMHVFKISVARIFTCLFWFIAIMVILYLLFS